MIWYDSFIVCRMKDTSRKNNMFAQFRKNERDKQKLIDTVVKQLKNLIATNQAWESQCIGRQPALRWLAAIRAPPVVGHTIILTSTSLKGAPAKPSRACVKWCPCLPVCYPNTLRAPNHIFGCFTLLYFSFVILNCLYNSSKVLFISFLNLTTTATL